MHRFFRVATPITVLGGVSLYTFSQREQKRKDGESLKQSEQAIAASQRAIEESKKLVANADQVLGIFRGCR